MTQSVVMNRSYSKKEEFWNALTHGIGALLTIPALILLIGKAQSTGTKVELISYIVFGISMFLLYFASTLYHSIPKHKVFLKKMDHSSIFLLIAGTYTPVALIAIGGTAGGTLVGIEWGLAVIGIILKQFFVHRFKRTSLLVYISMGWLVIFVFQPVMDYLTIKGVLVLLAGGLSYTIGTYFYQNKNIPYNHAIWHVFVMVGSLFMFLAIYYFL
ncbi:hemolysin III family protein [Ureibacillus thermophilus]|uniref:PAQR family membrane homeostasis protein TrhA n=1 Tax=Ureibacillus thermophilus TaxID=367743 RepID=UPI00360D80B5